MNHLLYEYFKKHMDPFSTEVTLRCTDLSERREGSILICLSTPDSKDTVELVMEPNGYVSKY